MIVELGRIRELYRYPVKSMAGTAVESVTLGWYGLDGDRRFAFRRLSDSSGFPWLSASRLPEMLLYKPFGRDESADEPLPTHVTTPEGMDLELQSEELRKDLSRRFGSDLELMRLNHGMFDAAHVSVITVETIRGIESYVDDKLDHRRFRPNIILDSPETKPFGEDSWVGGTLVFGDNKSGAAVSVTMPDERCMMINLDPDTVKQNPAILKTVVRMNNNNAGIYGMVTRTGKISVGQPVSLILGSAD